MIKPALKLNRSLINFQYQIGHMIGMLFKLPRKVPGTRVLILQVAYIQL